MATMTIIWIKISQIKMNHQSIIITTEETERIIDFLRILILLLYFILQLIGVYNSLEFRFRFTDKIMIL
jgi:hypothetical protein